MLIVVTRGSPSNPAATCCKQTTAGEQSDAAADERSQIQPRRARSSPWAARNSAKPTALRRALSPATPGSMRFDDDASQLPTRVTRAYAAGATRV